MMCDREGPAVSRRAALAGGAGALVSSAGCVQRLRIASSDGGTESLVVRITFPAGDYDPFAAAIARRVADGLEAAGIDYRTVPQPQDELYRQVLLDFDFDCYISRLPFHRQPDPDVLYSLLHSRFRGEWGWQNPFGFTNIECDDLLATQRRGSDEERIAAVSDLQQLLGRTQPFVPLVRPTVITGVRRNRFDGWETALQAPPTGLLELNRVAGDGLRLGSTDPRTTVNRNPISAIHSNDLSVLGLLYDSLAVTRHGEFVPWLARDIEWEGDSDPEANTLHATLTLRSDARWHDGEPLTASDVRFTYRFLQDTADGGAVEPIAAPRFRGESSLVESATVLDSRTVRLTFEETTRAVAERALTVPVLPVHIWVDKTEVVSVAGIELESATEALVWDNPGPVGSGPLQFESATAQSAVELTRFDDHFLYALDDGETLSGITAPPFETLTVNTQSSSNAVVESLSVGDIDASSTPLESGAVERIEDEPALSLVGTPSYASYHIGFNTRSSPFGDPNFRRTVARLCDKAALVREVFDGYGEPIASPLAGTDWLADDLAWDGGDPAAPFLGIDGEVDAQRAREAFRDIGYRYNENNELVV